MKSQKFYDFVNKLRLLLRRILPCRIRRFIVWLIPRRILWFLFPDKNLKGRILFIGPCLYHTWYLSRALRQHGWKADVLDSYYRETNIRFYHGQDFILKLGGLRELFKYLRFYIYALRNYDIFQFHDFTQFWMLPFYGPSQHELRYNSLTSLYGLSDRLPERLDIKLLKRMGKKIVYTTSGCRDAVSPTSFRSWYPDESGDEPLCDYCQALNNPNQCTDENRLAFGKLRNSLVDYVIDMSGNRKDYQDDPLVHDIPEFWCLDSNFWRPDILIPTNYRLSFPENVVKIYHSVGNLEDRCDANYRNPKSTHIYLPVIERLKAEGYQVELIFFYDVPNKKLRYYQAQADIFADMLTFGFFGANIREGMMLGKPCVCYLRPVWLENIRKQVPQYVEELPVINATPATVYDVLKDLIEHPEKRKEIGRRSREFAVKWHSAEAGTKRMEQIYLQLLHGKTP